ncbi:MAG TPA: trypsin-like serine protease, partial [Polyangia bacterium]|nr:trypsin-like serine protease [Polyangia bacterium]
MRNRERKSLSNVTVHRPANLAALGLSLAMGAAACGSAPAEQTVVDNRGSKIIGGFAANDPVLDAIGSLVVHFGPLGSPFGAPQELCGATLIGPETVLTAKHCGLIVPQIVSLGWTLTFAVGPNSLYPKREINIVAVDLAPGDLGGFVGVGHDVAVMHLETPITDIDPVDLTVLSDDQIGAAFAAIGYGIQDNSAAFGTRRLGKQTLRSRQGKVF